MTSRIAEALGSKHAPVAILLTDRRPASATQFKPEAWGCVASMLIAASRGRVCLFDRESFGCPGGGTGLGFGNCYVGFPIDRLLSTGGRTAMANGRSIDMGEGERFLASPELAARWADALPYRQVPTEYVVFKSIEQVTEEEEVSLVHMFVNPDQLSALVTLAGFRTGSIDATISPWGAACQSILFAYAEAESENPRGVIGFFDISQRPKCDRELLSYTVPHGKYLEMESSVDDSFLPTSAWEKLRGRW
jgi:uncharacterized protein (DUF169 family)